ncbi:apolipoprotein N-acyltransferase [Sphingomonas sp.]|uniref:apolipoprotein N-acyltransferase n=1 Tax=Sphingomonas sp. TaxID=28214 RepID=UPI002C895F76|nr:apolipoprotein N-acyltransferase [Sphingomonas sp.]HTG38431.1 apolipoprotein N-acyltransferase [Sphingomonas sp.]
MIAMLARRPYAVLLIAGALSATGFAPLELFPVTLAALALLMWLVHEAPGLKAALLRGWVFGVAHFTIGNNWIQHAFDYQDKMPASLGYLAVVLLALYLAIYPAMAAGLAWRLASPRAAGDARTAPGGSYVLVFAAAWIATEWLRATMFTGYAWNPIGVIWLPLISVARLAAFVGTYALSGITVAVAGALMLLVGWQRWRMPAVAVAGLLLAGIFASARPVPGRVGPDTPHVRVVQPNVGQGAMQDGDYDPRILQAMIDHSGTPQRHPRLIVWPEGAVNYYLEDGYPQDWYWKGTAPVTRGRIAALLGPRDMALVGATAIEFDADGQVAGAGNSIFTIDPAGRLGEQRYDKAHLVPYGEYLPMRPILSRIGLSRLVAGEIDYLPGPGPRTLDVPGFGQIGMQVCYEIIFSGEVVDRADRPDMIFNPSNDGWFGAWGPPEHLAQARLRAIEEGLPVIRSTPTGISAVIDARGRVVASIGMDRAGAVEVPIPAPLPPTLFARMGNAMTAIVALLMLGTAIAIRRLAR